MALFSGNEPTIKPFKYAFLCFCFKNSNFFRLSKENGESVKVQKVILP